MAVVVIIDNLAYRLGGNTELEVSPVVEYERSVRVQQQFHLDCWMPVPKVGLRTPRQEAMLAHIKAALETAEISQLCKSKSRVCGTG